VDSAKSIIGAGNVRRQRADAGLSARSKPSTQLPDLCSREQLARDGRSEDLRPFAGTLPGSLIGGFGFGCGLAACWVFARRLEGTFSKQSCSMAAELMRRQCDAKLRKALFGLDLQK